MNYEEIKVVAEYKYPGCVVNEQQNCSRMVEEIKGKSGSQSPK